MPSRLSANKSKEKEQRFSLAWWHFLLFAILGLSIILLLFPQRMMVKMLESANPNAVSLIYLRNMVAQNPNNPVYKNLLAQQELSMGDIKLAERLIKPYYTLQPETPVQWQTLLTEYSIVRTKAYMLPSDSVERQNDEQAMKQMIEVLAKSPYIEKQGMASVANDAVALGDVKLGVNLYQKIAASGQPETVGFYENAARYALFVSDYAISANMYFLAEENSTDINAKRNYFLKALDSLRQGNLINLALTQGQEHLDGLENDSIALGYLSELALEANRPDLALVYVQRSLQLKFWSN